MYNIERNINESVCALDYNKEKKSQNNQPNNHQFLFTNDLKVPTEIVAFCLTPNLNQVCYGTQEYGSQFVLMDIQNLSIIKKFTLSEMATPLIIRFSDD